MGTADGVSEIIEDHGWAVIKVEESDEEPNFAYSLGLFRNFAHPEVIIFGLSPEILQQIINVIGEGVRRGERFEPFSTTDEVLEGYECTFREVSSRAIPHYMGVALNYYGQDFPAVHCVWPDRRGNFPWEPATDPEFRRLQPMLSEGPERATYTRPRP